MPRPAASASSTTGRFVDIALWLAAAKGLAAVAGAPGAIAAAFGAVGRAAKSTMPLLSSNVRCVATNWFAC
jgi:hypothetical protein